MAVDTIRSLKAAGLEVFAVDRSPAAPAAAVADGFRAVDFADAAAVEAYAAEIRADVILPVSDAGVITAAKVNEALRLPGIGLEVARRYVSKAEMRAAWESAGLQQPRFAVARSADEIACAAEQVGWPVVVKPAVNAGSRGVSFAANAGEVAWSADFARQHSPGGTYVVEEFIRGTEITVEGLVRNGEAVVLACSDKAHQRHPRFLVAMSLNYPAALTALQYEAVEALVRGAVRALGAYDGAFHAECIVNEKGPHLVEIHARGGGGHIFGRIIEAVSGIVAPLAAVRLIRGEAVETMPTLQRGACYRFFAPPPGRFVCAAGIEEARAVEGVLDLGFALSAGAVVGAIAGDADRPGFVVTTGATREDAMSVADRAIAAIRFVMEPL
jgi:biotin carboxylase